MKGALWVAICEDKGIHAYELIKINKYLVMLVLQDPIKGNNSTD